MKREGWIVAVVFGVLSFLLGIQENGFPYYYHIDEPTKTAQLVEGYRNFNHPLLLLTVSDLVASVSGLERTHQNMALVGRTVSALFTALAVAMMTLLAYWKGDRIAALCAGFFLAGHWDLFEKAHYLKEDPALCFGFAATFLALANYRRHQTVSAAVFLGAGVGLAASGKYLGIVALPFALPVFFLYSGRRWRDLGIFFVGFLFTLAVVNYPVLTPGGIAQFRESLGVETSKATRGTWAEPTGYNWGFFERILYVSRAHMLVFFGWAYVIMLGKNRRETRYVDWVIALFPFLLAGLLGFSTKTSGRYFLPAVMVVCFVSGLGLASLLRGLVASGWRFRKVVVVFLILVAVGGSAERFNRYYQGFYKDPRAEMATFVRDGLPAGSVVVQGYGVHLPDPGLPRYREVAEKLSLGKKILSPSHPPDLGTLDELRAKGVTHVAVTGQNYERYLNAGGRKPKKGRAERYYHRQKFYKALFGDCKLVWEREADRVGTHNPPLRIYAIGDIREGGRG